MHPRWRRSSHDCATPGDLRRGYHAECVDEATDEQRGMRLRGCRTGQVYRVLLRIEKIRGSIAICALLVLMREGGNTLKMRFATSSAIILDLGLPVTAGQYS